MRRDVYALGELGAFNAKPTIALRPASAPPPRVSFGPVRAPAPAPLLVAPSHLTLHPAAPSAPFVAPRVSFGPAPAAAAPAPSGLLFNPGGFGGGGGGASLPGGAPEVSSAIPLPLGDIAAAGVSSGAWIVGGVVAAGLAAFLLLRKKRR